MVAASLIVAVVAAVVVLWTVAHVGPISLLVLLALLLLFVV